MKTRMRDLLALLVLALATVALVAADTQETADTLDMKDPQAAPVAPAKPAKPATTPRPAMRAVMAPEPYFVQGGRSYLGVDIREITEDRVAKLKLKEERGVEITMVDQDAPAGKAGLKEGDVVLEFNGTRVEGEEQLRRLLRETPPGRTVILGISRDGQMNQIKATLGDRKEMEAKSYAWTSSTPRTPRAPRVIQIPDIELPAFDVVVRSYSSRTGMMVDNLTPQLGEFFGVKSGEGVLVRSVEKGSAAEAAGIKAGDVIIKANNEKISDRNDWRSAMRNKGGKINLGVIREKREQSLTLTLPEVKPKDESRKGLDFDFDFDFEGMEPEIEWMGEEDGKMTRLRDRIHHELAMKVPDVRLKIERAQAEAHRAVEQSRKFIERDVKRELERARVEVRKVVDNQDEIQRKISREMDKARSEIDRARAEIEKAHKNKLLWKREMI